MKQISVQLDERSYEIKIGKDLLSKLGKELLPFKFSQTCLLITNPLILKLYGDQVRSSLNQAGFKTTIALVEDGEQAKSLEWAAKLYDTALEARLDRNSPIIALGGGVVGDLAGFIAATYMRGVPFIQVPTTLLAQVDSSVGGKVAINHPKGKNMIGAFYQPKLVLTDLNTLRTLPTRELRSGLAEVIKYGVIWDKDFFEYMESNLPKAMSFDDQVLEEIIAKSCLIKAAIIQQDEKENSLRAILNFGHTFGHAYEALTEYSEYRHGEAVAMGMIAATRFACYKGYAEQKVLERLELILSKVGLLLEPGQTFLAEKVIEAMKFDKKVKSGQLQLILPQNIGDVIRLTVDPQEVEAFLKADKGGSQNAGKEKIRGNFN